MSDSSFLCIGTFTPQDRDTLHAVIEVSESLGIEMPNPQFATVRFGIEYNGQATRPPSPPDENGVMRYTLTMKRVRGEVPLVPGMENAVTRDTALGFAPPSDG